MEDKKIRIYCGFVGTGKTYFCKHNAGGADIEEAPSVQAQLSSKYLTLVYRSYLRNGYRIVTNASPYVFKALMQDINKYEIIIVIPPPEMKEEILQRVGDRGDKEGYPYLCSVYDNFYKNLIQYPIPAITILLKPGEYIGDIITQYEKKHPI